MGARCQVLRVTKSGRAGEGRVHEHVNIENSSGDPSSVDDGHLQKPSKPKYGAAANLSVRRPESIALLGPKSIYTSRHIVSFCAKLQQAQLDTLSEIEALLDSRNIYTASCISLFSCVRNFKQT